MKITKDSQRQLNLHPLTVYFMLTPEENEEYGEMLLTFNDKKELTFGLFEFKTLVWANNEDDPDLSDDINALQKKNNIMVRLFDDEDGNYQYATQKLKLNEGYVDIAYSVNTFMTKVYKKDYALLKGQGDATAETFRMFYEAYKDGNMSLGSMLVPSRGNQDLNDIHQDGVANLLFEKIGLSEDEAEKMADKIREIIANETCANNDGPIGKHDVKAEIKMVPYKRYKNRYDNCLGVEYIIDGEIVPVSRNQQESVMLLICTLLRTKMKKKLYVYEFLNNGKKPDNGYKTGNLWMRKAYDLIFSVCYNLNKYDKNFDEWCEILEDKVIANKTESKNKKSVIRRPGHPLYLNYGRLNKKIKECLIEHHRIDAYHYCSLPKPSTDGNKVPFYYINIQPENIIVPKEFDELLDEDNFNEWVRTR